MTGAATEAPASASAADLDVVIVNWNSGALLRACVASLAGAESPPAVQVVVVDNASGDGSAEALPAQARPLILERNRDNAGFGRACNQGAALGCAPVILFLNPDTRVEPESLAIARAHLMADARIGIVGAQLVDADGAVQRACARRPSGISLIAHELHLDRLMPGRVKSHFMTEWDHAATGPVDQVMGAFLMIRRAVFERLGGFDPRFHVYYEDVDLCARAWDAGLGVHHVAEARVRHQGQGTTRQAKARRLFYIQRSRILYAGKHHGTGVALGLLAAAFLAQLPMRLARALVRGAPREALEVLHAALLLARAVPGLYRRTRAAPRA